MDLRAGAVGGLGAVHGENLVGHVEVSADPNPVDVTWDVPKATQVVMGIQTCDGPCGSAFGEGASAGSPQPGPSAARSSCGGGRGTAGPGCRGGEAGQKSPR